MRLIAVLFSFFAMTLPGFAAEFTPLKEGPCFARLSGQIVEGDAAKFATFEKANPREFGPGDSFLRNRLCLDSPGGSLKEGVAVANYIAKVGIGTRIENDRSCLSACALIFMMGRGGGEDSSEAWVDRTMHINGQLGFHRPSLNLAPGGTYSGAQINQSFKLALDATLGFVSLANKAVRGEDQPAIPPDLFELMFEREGNDFFYVDTVNHAGRWNIALDGFQMPRALSEPAAVNACHNLLSWPVALAGPQLKRRETLGVYDGELITSILSADDNGPTFEIIGDYHVIEGFYCIIKAGKQDDRVAIQGCGYHNSRGSNVGGAFCNNGNANAVAYLGDADQYAIFPAELPLAQIPAQVARIEAEAATSSLKPKRLSEVCRTSNDQSLYVTNVKNFVNLRKEVGFETDVLSEAPLGSRLESTGSLWLMGEESRRTSCDRLCISAGKGAASAGDLTKLGQCFQDNVIWYQVRDGNGAIGFVSGKYLRF